MTFKESQLTLDDFLARGAAVYGGEPGVLDEPHADGLGALTYRELAGRVRRLGAGLAAAGVQRGERVAVLSQNSARLLELFYAVPGSGRVIVPINFRLSAQEIAYVVEHSQARLLLYDPELEPLVRALPCRRIALGAASDAALLGDAVAITAASERDLASINYTSGTTARPKGVELTHRNVWLNATLMALHLGLSDRDVYLHTVPMFHANGWGMPYACAGLGVPQVILRKVDGAEVLRRVERHGITIMGGAPTVVDMVLAAAREWGADTPGRGRVRVLCGGAPPPTRTIARLEDELGWEFMQIYGLTETAPLLVLNRARPADRRLPDGERHARLRRGGPPVLGARVRIAADGEILARGHGVLRGYWRDVAATEAALAGNWFHTGDGGRLDDDGHVIVGDRKKDMIISGGENVAAAEVEERLHAHPGVAEAAVIGVPHPHWGETVKAVVVPAPGAQLTGEALIAFARAGLAHYKCPTIVELVPSLPRTATGKVQKYVLRRAAA
jgi:acyl-CoA synthetase (AMP-forming)/AMP-acid ligase II